MQIFKYIHVEIFRKYKYLNIKLEDGRIKTDECGQTSQPGVFAIGDVTGSPWLAHKASHEGIRCVEHINNPGIKSIEAALYPEDTDYLYFVAKGDGYHSFSTNQSDHLKAKREYKRQKRMQ